MRSNFKEYREARIARMKTRAIKAENESKRSLSIARQMMGVIPLGQPILVGHHSEKRHRRFLDKIHNAYGKGFKLQEKADRLRSRAASAECEHVIFSDDPEAIRKLKEKLADLEKSHDLMKKANAIIRKAKGDQEKMKAGLLSLSLSTENVERILTGYNPMYGAGFPAYKLQYNNADIRRVKQRIEKLEKELKQKNQEFVFGEVRLVDSVDDNRVQLFFPGKPSEEIRKTLKSRGFRWAPSVGAWQRHRSTVALQYAKEIALL